MPPSSSTPVDAQDHADACGGDERSSSSGVWAPLPSSCAPSSRQQPSADGQDHQVATSRVPCDDGADHSSPSASPCRWRCLRGATGSRSAPPVVRGRGSRLSGCAVVASRSSFCDAEIYERAANSKNDTRSNRCASDLGSAPERIRPKHPAVPVVEDAALVGDVEHDAIGGQVERANLLRRR